jgi:hypothetical protein
VKEARCEESKEFDAWKNEREEERKKSEEKQFSQVLEKLFYLEISDLSLIYCFAFLNV